MQHVITSNSAPVYVVPNAYFKQAATRKDPDRPYYVHGFMVYICEHCGHLVNMYLEMGLEDPNMPGHKPVPFVIPCPKCHGNTMSHQFWGVGESDKYEKFSKDEDYSMFVNLGAYDCGVPYYAKDENAVWEDDSKAPLNPYEVNRQERRHPEGKHMNTYTRPRSNDTRYF